MLIQKQKREVFYKVVTHNLISLKKIYSFFIPAGILLAGFCYSQTKDFSNVLDAFENNTDILSELQKIDTINSNIQDKATWYYYYSDYNYRKDKHHEAYKAVLTAKRLFQSLKNESDIMDCNILILAILSHQNDLKTNSDKILEELENYGRKNKDQKVLSRIYYQLASQSMDNNDAEESITYFRKIIEIALQNNDSLQMAYGYDNIGTVHLTINQNPDSALYYSKKANPFYIKFNDKQSLSYNYNNQAQQYKAKKNYKKSIAYYLKADSITLDKFEAKTKVIFYENLAQAYKLDKDYKNASLYFEKYQNLKDSINDMEQNIAISEIKEKFDNEKLRADNLETEAKRIQNRNLLYGALVLIVFGGVVFFLIQKNTKRKQKLAEQEKVLESQKLATVLKEQELKAIDAMIAGQEKERQRIANDLHDDLGGLMATVKLHFNALKDKKSPELFEKTNTLIDEAYQKVRTVAHAKNAGVIAKQGLLKAVQNMADNISASNQIQIDVLDHGLDQRLENSLELSLFRIIQELTTNIIKHAQATEATIHLTNHDDSINIMVEDNGIGFNPNQITKTSKGMGISSIDKRVEHLDGKLTIESETNKGTTIIIDIPL